MSVSVDRGLVCLVIGSMAMACAQRGVSGDEVADEVGDESSTGEDADTNESSTDDTTETETETESTSSTTGEPECRDTEDCESGICVDGACVPCTEDWECHDSDEPCMQGYCVEGECTVGPQDCSFSGCHVGTCVPASVDFDDTCAVELCTEYDGVADLRLTVTGDQALPTAAIDLGASLRVLGYRSCERFTIVRAVDGPLLMVHIDGLNPSAPGWTQGLTERFGADWDTLTAPLVIDYLDPELCPILETECGDQTRGATDIALGPDDPEPARIFDSQFGWGPGNYFANVRRLWFTTEICYALPFADFPDVSVLLDGCEGCGAKTQQAGCFPGLANEDEPQDGFRVELLFDDESAGAYPYDYFDFECAVIGESADQDFYGNEQAIRELDCVPLSQPTEFRFCEG